ncbi:short-chain fatty acyl-CoA regulator family protein [Actinoallomurus sp. NPDC052274]|uniref:short-chain fatty acyl-CoA regulator family protein n=1 Tax=Actinoallomurus sp. NPDC052274 TaxID=3155420 RepID=UPI003438BBC7
MDAPAFDRGLAQGGVQLPQPRRLGGARLGVGRRAPRADFAVALGCEARHAHRLVYGEGIALDDPRAATPIGRGCRICERRDCAQRARPMAGGRLAIDANRRSQVPYRVLGGS